ncbi:MAG: hypothetical protein M1454_02330 [Candidatus Thermoplasmatota archaeon]|nr:hypothetical protein [Candidatus Thermoplasmatota archaeon]MCL5730649.1 hypothetical protein [Candidatus Thermoplasmatota archaeon]
MRRNDVAALKGILKLSEEEEREISDHPERFSEIIDSITREVRKHFDLTQQKLELMSRYASLNYSIYDLFMSAHDNAIVIGGLNAEAKMRGIDLGKDADEKIKIIMDRYLMIDPTYGVQERDSVKRVQPR